MCSWARERNWLRKSVWSCVLFLLSLFHRTSVKLLSVPESLTYTECNGRLWPMTQQTALAHPASVHGFATQDIVTPVWHPFSKHPSGPSLPQIPVLEGGPHWEGAGFNCIVLGHSTEFLFPITSVSYYKCLSLNDMLDRCSAGR